ncbi:hypothetical protein [Halioxenophilus aromaticivorans]|uniref:Uncharacterized protein n=1 Tax=Halioxenophilus aromaticivorans TaxID=1306992 RepID=A0AAV3TX78_9ALTE
MELSRLVLEYIKVLMWPVVLAAVLLMYSEEVLKIISTREVDAFGLKIGGNLENLAETYESEIAALKDQIAQLQSDDSGEKTQLLTKLSNISSNVRQDLTALRTQVEAPAEQTTVNKQEAMVAEEAGFNALKNKDIKTAIEQFSLAEEKWPAYHNVAEINALLKRYQSNLTGPAQWQSLYQTLLTDYSWGMPQAVRSDLLRVTPALRGG